MLRTAGSSSYPEKMCQRAIQVPTRSAGSMSSDCPIPYQLKMRPPVPCSPNSGYSLGNTWGCEVQSQCVVCRRCSVSAVPNSPDCTTKASRPAIKHNRNTGLLSFSPKREVIALDGNKRGLSTSDVGPQTSASNLRPRSAGILPAVLYFPCENAEVRSMRYEVQG